MLHDRRLLRGVLLVAVVLALPLVGAGSALSACGSTTIAAGTGVAGDPYQVTSRADLEQIGASAANMACQYTLMNDIALGGIGSPWTPLGPGSPTTKFTGTLLGNGKTISGLAFSTSSDTVGLFRELGGATISNLTLSALSITADHQLGAIAGLVSAGTNTLTGVSVAGTVTASIATPAYGDVGGLVGVVASGATLILASPTTSATVSSTQACVGGLVGENDGTLTVTGAAVAPTVSGSSAVGGVLGFAPSGSVTSVDGATLEVSIATGANVGGVVGFTYSTLTVANVAGSVTAADVSSAGGIVGRTIAGGPLSAHDISLSVAMTASSSGRAGGVIGDGGNPSVALADVTVAGTISSASGSDIGGIVGALRLQTSASPAASIQRVTNASMTISTGGSYAGGIIGHLTSGQTAAQIGSLVVQGGSVSGASGVGGIVGYWSNQFPLGQATSIDKAVAHSTVTAAGGDAGGIVGLLDQGRYAMTFTSAYADGAITGGTGAAGGLVGRQSSSYTPLTLSLLSDYGASTLTGASKGALLGTDTRAESATIWYFTNSIWSSALSTATTARVGSSNLYGSASETPTAMATITPYTTAGWAIRAGWQDPTSRTDTWGTCGLVNSGRPFLMIEHAAEPCLVAPGSPTATAGDASATISFASQPAGAVSVTNYEYQLDGGAWTAVSPASASTTIVLAGLANGTTYSVKVRAVGPNGAGDAGPASTTVSVTPSAPVPSGTASATTSSRVPSRVVGRLVVRGTPAAAWIGVGRSDAAPDAIRTVISTPGAGVVHQTGRLLRSRRDATGRVGGWRICAGTAPVVEAGRQIVSCRLTRRARAALLERTLIVRLTIAFTGADGSIERAVRRVVLGRAVASTTGANPSVVAG